MPVWANKPAAVLSALALGILVPGLASAQTSDLVSHSAFRVCADPASYPMSMQDGSGYENKIAELIASKLELPVQYTWFPMATGFVRKTLLEKHCDVIIGFAQGYELVQNTNHYYTSAFGLIVPADSELADVTQLDDPRLKDLRIGIIAGSPPATQMARYGLIGHAKPYNLVVDRRVESPAQDMLNDLEAKQIDAAILWGPLGGPLIKSEHPDLKFIPLIHETLPPKLFYRITMGVRPGEKVWEHKLNSLIRRNQKELNAILIEAGVPLLNDQGDAVLQVAK